MKKIWVLFFLVLLVSAGIAGYKKFSTEPEIQILKTAEVKRGDIKAVLVETGIIKPQVGARVKIGARATGEIIEMRVEIGSRVKKGELIARIDDREIVKTIDQTKAAIASKRYTLMKVVKTYPKRINEARANFDYAVIEYEREKNLIRHDYTKQDAVDKTKSRFEASAAILKRLQDEFTIEQKIVRSDIRELEARLGQQKIKLSYTKIVAPIDGIVSDVTAQEGETIVTGLQVANLVTVLDTLRLEMWIYVDETDISSIKTGQHVEYYVDTYPDKTFKGNIEKIYPQPIARDNITYYLAIARIPEDDAAFLKPEMTTYAKIVYNEKQNILTIPNAAIKFEEGRQTGYKVTGDQKVEKIDLKIGIRGENRSEIISGADDGDILATKLIIPVLKKK